MDLDEIEANETNIFESGNMVVQEVEETKQGQGV
jgi:hypothetical protein